MASAALLLLAGCTATPEAPAPAPEPPSPYRDCTGLTAAGPAAARPLPDVTLPCFTGGAAVRVADLRGPAVINFWKTACAPCRDELPTLQRLAGRTGGALKVIGVVTQDRRAVAAEFGTDLGLTFANLDDPDGTLLARLGSASLPTTVFVDGQGAVRHVYRGTALTDDTLGALVRKHLPEVTG